MKPTDPSGWKHAGGPASAVRRRGFTLIELLLAIVIFAVVLAAVNGVFFGAMRLRAKTALMLEQSLPLQQVMALLRRDLSGLVAPGTLSGPMKSGVASDSLTSQEGIEFFCNTGAASDFLPWSSVQKVAYGLREPRIRTGARGRDLVRLVTRNLLAPVQDQPEEQWLMDGVDRFDLSYYDGTQWRTSWDSTTEPTVLPKAVRVQIALADQEDQDAGRMRTPGRRPPQELFVPILITASTNQTQSAGGAP